MATKRIPLVLTTNPRSYSVSTINTVDQLSKNVVFSTSKNPATQEQTILVMGREPEASFATDGSGETTSIVAWTGKGPYYSAFARGATNSTIYTNDNTTSTSLGAITGQAIHMSETVISGVANVVAISASGSGRTWFFPDGGALTEITDTDYPPKQGTPIALTGNAVHINGKMGVMTANPARLYESDINSLSSWGAANYLSLNKLPDWGVGPIRYREHIVCFGANGAEFLRDVGNPTPGSSFVSEGFISVGCVNEHAMVEWNDTIAFIGRSGANFGVYLLEGMGAKKISPDWLDSAIAAFAKTTPPRIFIKQSDGHQYLAISNGVVSIGGGAVDQEIIYHDNVGLWGEWTLASANCTLKTAPRTDCVLIAAFTGGVQKNDITLRQSFSVRSAFFDLGSSKKKFLNRLSVIGPPPNASTDLTVTVYQDGIGVSSSRTMTLSPSAPRPWAHRWGSARAIAAEIAYTGSSVSKANALSMQAVELEFEEAST